MRSRFLRRVAALVGRVETRAARHNTLRTYVTIILLYCVRRKQRHTLESRTLSLRAFDDKYDIITNKRARIYRIVYYLCRVSRMIILYQNIVHSIIILEKKVIDKKPVH